MKLLIIGEYCQDVFVYGECLRLNPEAPVPVFTPHRVVSNPGMAGNVELNAQALGADTTLVRPRIHECCPIKRRFVDERSDQQLLRVDEHDDVPQFEPAAFQPADIIMRSDALVISDYDKGFLSLNDIEGLCVRATVHDVPVFLDTKKNHIPAHVVEKCTALKINQKEFAESDLDPEEDWESLIVTHGERGAVWRGHRYPVEHPVEVRDVAGAGDTFLAALAVRYVETQDMAEAIRFANRCAAWVVGHKGVAVIDREAV
jgi:D-beta-D-heptose 7-phosphate kinase/D-beta-D-heptose 1-phosphate adenosyltransferase